MVARAHERFAARAPARRRPARVGEREGALPNLIVIGGLKCGTTSLHHYLNLHPQIAMSRPKELNFFVAELNWALGRRLVREPLRAPRRRSGARPRRTTRTARASTGVAERMRAVLGEARLVYMVRDPIDRMLSHYLHNVGGGYETARWPTALADPEPAYVDPQPLRVPARALPRGSSAPSGSRSSPARS